MLKESEPKDTDIANWCTYVCQLYLCELVRKRDEELSVTAPLEKIAGSISVCSVKYTTKE